MTEHIEIQPSLGGTIEDAVNTLIKHREQGILAKTRFNGVWLYSDTVTMDDAYLKITGINKAMFDKMQADRQAQHKREIEEHEAKIPELTDYWIEEGNKVLTEDKKELWAEIVPIRLGDLYRGMELKCCLDIVRAINVKTYENYKRAKQILNKQDHSGMSYGLTRSMVEEFAPNGKDFYDYIKRNSHV